MNLTVTLIYLLMCIAGARSITCVVCTNLNTAACGDPFNSNGGNIGSLANQTYCRKSVAVNGIITRSATDATCSTPADLGVTSVYCCSDVDFCNRGTDLHQSEIAIVLCAAFSVFLGRV